MTESIPERRKMSGVIPYPTTPSFLYALRGVHCFYCYHNVVIVAIAEFLH